MRAVAVLAVIVYHAWPNIAPWGFIGVDSFFVISGYLITGIIARELAAGDFRVVRFYQRRVRRIFPALLLVLAVSLIAGFVLLLPGPYERLGKHVAAAAAFIGNISLWSEAGYFDTEAAQKPLMHLWSLGVEEQFYLLWPAVLMAVNSSRRNVMLSAIFIASLALSIVQSSTDATAAFFSPLTRIWELSLGGLLALNEPLLRRMPRAAKGAIAVVACAFAIAAILFIDARRPYPGAWALLPTVATALLILTRSSTVNFALSLRPLVWVGLISYPLYLWHWPILSFLRQSFELPSNALTAAAIGVAVLCAAATYHFIESPLRRCSQLSAVTICSLAAMGLVGFLGLAVWFRAGLPQRYPTAVSKAVAPSFDLQREWRLGSCFIDGDAGPEVFASCPDKYRPQSTVLLWGDSHAAHLYPGLRQILGAEGLVQRTASACPPMLDMPRPSRPRCVAVNQFVIDEVRARPPRLVVLAGGWAPHWDYHHLRKTLEALRNAGVHRVIVLGAFPRWPESVPALVHKEFRKDPLHRLPERLNLESASRAAKVDPMVRSVVEGEGFIFAAPVDTLCDQRGCLVRVGDLLTTWDLEHLTVAGATYVSEHVLRLANHAEAVEAR